MAREEEEEEEGEGEGGKEEGFLFPHCHPVHRHEVIAMDSSS